MPLSTKNTFEAEIIGGIFASCRDADGANQASLPLDVPENKTDVIFHLDDIQAREAFTEVLVKAIRSGSIRVAADSVTTTVPVIEVIEDIDHINTLQALIERDFQCGPKLF